MMPIKKYTSSPVSRFGPTSASEKKIEKRSDIEKKDFNGYIEKTAVYDTSAGGVITSDGYFVKTTDTSWRPDGYKDLGTRKTLMVKKSRGLKDVGMNINVGTPQAQTYDSFAQKYIQEQGGADKVNIVKDEIGRIISVKAKPIKYLKTYTQASSGRTYDYDEYSPKEATFDEKGNIVEEVDYAPYRTYLGDRPNSFKTTSGIMKDVVKKFTENQKVKELDYDFAPVSGTSGRNYDISYYGTYLKDTKDYELGMQTTNSKPGFSGRETFGGKSTFYDRGQVRKVMYNDGRDYEFQRLSQPNVINKKLMMRDLSRKMELSGNTKTAENINRYLRGGNLNSSTGIKSFPTLSSIGNSNNKKTQDKINKSLAPTVTNTSQPKSNVLNTYFKNTAKFNIKSKIW